MKWLKRALGILQLQDQVDLLKARVVTLEAEVQRKRFRWLSRLDNVLQGAEKLEAGG